MIIGFAGKAGSGKSTACELLKPLGYTEINFADTLKVMAAQLLSFPIEYCYDQEEKAKVRDIQVSRLRLQALLNDNDIYHLTFDQDFYNFRTLRMFLQFLGDLFKRHDTNYWIRRALSNLDTTKDYVIGDVRYESEADAIRELGGSVVLINSPRTSTNIDEHSSEQLKLTTDYALTNTDLKLFKRDILAVEGLISNGQKSGQKRR